MKVAQELESVLLDEQNVINFPKLNEYVSKYLHVIRAYAEIEGAIVVLTDFSNYKSYVCIGFLGNQIGLQVDVNNTYEIDNIWEEEIFAKVHPDDLLEKHIFELNFFHFLKKIPLEERLKYSIDSRLRMLNIEGKYQYINHRTLYSYGLSDGKLYLALCVYATSVNQTLIEGIGGKILNNEKGLVVDRKEYNDCSDLLSSREKEILYYIHKGSLSKEIANTLNISQNTVNRHRQNILKKLGVSNSFEAIKIAQALDLL